MFVFLTCFRVGVQWLQLGPAAQAAAATATTGGSLGLFFNITTLALPRVNRAALDPPVMAALQNACTMIV